MTRRWTKIREVNGRGLSGERKKYYEAIRSLNRTDSTLRFVLAPCGRRSLKTELALRAMVLALGAPKQWDNPRYGVLGPTYKQVKQIAWPIVKALIPTHWVAKGGISESDLSIRTKQGSEIWMIGIDKPQRLEGPPWDGFHITEYADCKISWDQNIRPALMDRKGWAILEGTPDFDKPNNAKYEEQYNRAIDPKHPAWAAFTWRSREVISAEEIEEMRAESDPLYFEQEEGGKFVSAPNQAYYGFADTEESGNLDSSIEFNPSLPIYIACDFNYEHHNWIVGQVENRQAHKRIDGIPMIGQFENERHVNVLRQIYLQNADVDGMSVACQETLKEIEQSWQHKFPGRKIDPKSIIFTGDYSGYQRRAEATYRAWEIIVNAFPNAQFEVKLNPSVPDRLRDVNGYIVNTRGVRRLHVRPECSEIRKDMRYVTRTQLMTQQKSGDRSHATDALGYWINVIEHY